MRFLASTWWMGWCGVAWWVGVVAGAAGQDRGRPCVLPIREACDPHQEPRIDIANNKLLLDRVAKPGKTPWLASLQDTRFPKSVHFCGATILAPTWLLTAATCVHSYTHDLSHLRVVAGEWDLDTPERLEQPRRVLHILLHPEFDPRTRHMDVAILGVWPLRYDNRTAPLPLPPYSMVKVEGVGVVAGWGWTEGHNVVSNLVLSSEAPVLTRAECAEVYGSALTSSMMCAGNTAVGGLGPCQGDWGGALVMPDFQVGGYLVGVASWGVGRCGDQRFPAVYTDVVSVEGWIRAVIQCHPGYTNCVAPLINQKL